MEWHWRQRCSQPGQPVTAGAAATSSGGGGGALEDRLFTFPTVLTDAALTKTLTVLVREHWQSALARVVDVYRVAPCGHLHHETVTLRITTPNP
jgi:hypothetical protein